MNAKNLLNWSATGVMLVCVGSVVATPGVIDVDGTRADDPYPSQSLVNQASKAIDELLAGPVSASAQSDQSVPMGGEGVGDFAGSQLNGPPEDVFTGWEGRFNLQFLGWNGTDDVNIAGFINGGGGFLSNQVIGTIDPVNSGNLGVGVDFAAMMGNQFVTAGAAAAAEPTIDGSLDMSEAMNYVLLYTQETFTQFGDNNNPDPIANSGGSELDNVYAYISDPNGSLPVVDGDEWLNIFIGGNLEGNGNNLTLWFDVNSAAGISTGFGGGGVSNLGDLAGSTLEIGADWGVQYNRNSGAANHYFALVQQDGGMFAQGNGNAAFPSVTTLTDGMMNTIAEVTFDDSNVLGVAGSEFGGSLGGSDEPFESDPADDDTGVEIKLNLSDLGYDPMVGYDGMGGGVRVAGFIIEANAVSNQVLGGLPAGTGPLDAVSGVNFDAIAGDQFVVVNNTSMTSPVIDGVRDSAYGPAPQYVNNVGGTGNATNRTSPQGPSGPDDDPGGSEINNFSGVLVQESGDWILYMHTGGALGNFDRLYLYVDHTFMEGENQLSGFNPNIDDDRANNAAGLTFDTGFTADFLCVYRLGTDVDTMDVTHFFEGLEITTGAEDIEVAGSFGGGNKTNLLSGTIESRRGFGNNTDNTRTNANGDELAGFRAYLSQRNVTGTPQPYISLMYTGNLKPVFNKLNIFIDVDPDVGQSTLIWDGDLMTGEPTPTEGTGGGLNPAYVGNPPVDFDALQAYGGPFPDLSTPDPNDTLPGMTFDPGFEPDHFITVTLGNVSAGMDGLLGTADDDAEIFANFARLRTAGPDGIFDDDNMGDDDPGVGIFLGQTTVLSSTSQLTGGDPAGNGSAWQVAIDNRNTSGVPGGPDSFGITSTQNLLINAVQRGIEISFPTSTLRVDGQPWDGTGQIGFLAMIGNNSHTFMSSQFLPPVCAGELGDPRAINFATDHPKQQYIFIEAPAMATDTAYTVVPGQEFITFDECVEPIGACCMGESCSVLGQLDCEGMGGVFLGDGTDCGAMPIDNPCLTVRACCFADNTCLDLTSVQCSMAGGTSQAEGTACADLPDPCAPTNDCSADFDNDGDVDLSDFGTFGAAFGSMVGDGNYNPDADFDNDGDVDLSDFGTFGSQFGRTDCLD